MDTRKLLKTFGLAAALPLAAAILFTGAAGCKKEEPPPPQAQPTPVPPPPSGSVVYVNGGHLFRLDILLNQATPLTSGKSTEWFPVCSPLGDKVAYWSNAGNETYNLWVADMAGTARTQLTDHQTDSLAMAGQNLHLNNAPCWSPDGLRILYSLDGDIWEIDADGYNPKTILVKKSALCPFYHPKGNAVLFISNLEDTVYNLWSYSLEDKSLKKLTNYTDWNLGSPSLSADGNKILFSLFRENISQIYVMNTDGSSPANLTTNNASLCPRYAQNDKKIVFCTNKPEEVTLNVYMMNASGTDAKAITPNGGASPSWAAYLAPGPLPTPVTK